MADEKRLVHYLRLRASDDLPFLQGGMCDELIVNANQLENSPESTAAHLRGTEYSYMVDPVLWRFQVPELWRNNTGETKRNYRRLARRYSEGTDIRMEECGLLDAVKTAAEWERLAANIVRYQMDRLEVSSQLDLLDPKMSRELRPSRFIAPALVADSSREDEVNRILIEGATAAASEPVLAMVVIPKSRLSLRRIDELLRSVPDAGLRGVLLWTPGVTEDFLVENHDALAALVLSIRTLGGRGIPVIQTQLGYTAAALSVVGAAGVAHHVGWVDSGEPARESGGFARSCRTYVPGIRSSMRFHDAERCGRPLGIAEYQDRYCECVFCSGVFSRGEHPLDVLLEDQPVGQSTRRTPTSRATSANIWHYLLARSLEVHAFSSRNFGDVIGGDIERAAALAGAGQARHLERLARELEAA